MSRSKTLYYNDAKHWVKRPSGIVTPDGRCKDFLEYSQNSFVEIKQMAIEVDGMFHEAGIVLNPTCSLRQLIEDAKLLADTSVDGSVDSSERSVHMRGCLALRITQAILSLKDEPNITSHLSRLGSGSLNLFKKGESTVKNFFWEIETFASLKRHGLNPLFEEPDLSVSIDGVQIGVACKKFIRKKMLERFYRTQLLKSQHGSGLGSSQSIWMIFISWTNRLPGRPMVRLIKH